MIDGKKLMLGSFPLFERFTFLKVAAFLGNFIEEKREAKETYYISTPGKDYKVTIRAVRKKPKTSRIKGEQATTMIVDEYIP